MTLDISSAPVASDNTDHAPPPSGARALLARDLPASLAVFPIAVPFALAIALAAGAPLTAGLVAAAVGGLVAGLLGGAPLQVSGPSAALTVITAGVILQYGWQVACVVTVAAGLLQLLLGAVRVARAALAVSPAIVHGMLSGVGLTIALAQLHVVLGGSPQGHTLANLAALPGQLAGPHLPALAVGGVTIALLYGWPRLTRLPGRAGQIGRRLARFPAALVAVAAGTMLSLAARPQLAGVESPSWHDHTSAALPSGRLLAEH